MLVKRWWILVLTLVVAGWLVPAAADAAILKRVHAGRAVASATAVNIALDLPDASKAFVVCHSRTTAVTSNQRVTCILTTNNLQIDGGSGIGATTDVTWYVAEFESGVTVYRNTAVVTLASGSLTAAITINATGGVACDRSFAVVTNQDGDSTANAANDERFMVRGYLQDAAIQGVVCGAGATTNVLRIDRNESGTATGYAWQVVVIDSASVQRGLTTMTGTGLPAAPTAAAGAAGNVNVGTHSWKVTFVSAAGETAPSVASATLNIATSAKQVNLTNIPVGPGGTTARMIYRTVAGNAAPWKLVTTIANNSATSVTDNVADASLGAAVGTGNAAQAATASLTCADPAKTFVQMNAMASASAGGLAAQYTVSGALTRSGGSACAAGLQDQVALARGDSTTNADVAWEAVTLTDGSLVTSGSATNVNAGADGKVTSGAFTAVNLGSSLPFISFSGAPSTLGTQLHSASFTDATHLQFQRGNTTVTTASTIQFFVVSFFRCTDDPLCGVGAGGKAGEVRITPAVTYNTSPPSATVGCPLPGCANLVLRNTGSIGSDAPANTTQYAIGATVGGSTVVYPGYHTVTTVANGLNATSLTVASTAGFPSKCDATNPNSSPCRAVIYDALTGVADEFTYTGVTATTLTGIPGGGVLLALTAHPISSHVRVFPSNDSASLIPMAFTSGSTTAGATQVVLAASPIAAGLPTSGKAYLAGGKEIQYFGTEEGAGGSCASSACKLTGVSGVDKTYATGSLVLSSLTGFRDTGLTNGTTYNYKVFPKTGPSTYVNFADSRGNVSSTPLSGSVIWSFQPSGGAALNSPIPGNYRIYSSTTAAKIYGINWQDGTLAQSADTFAAATAYVTPFNLSSTGTEVVVGADDNGVVYSIDALTGAVNWATQMPNLAAQDGVRAGISIQIRAYSSAAFATRYSPGSYDVIFASTYSKDDSNSTDHRIVALRSDTGAILWTFRPNPTDTNPGSEMDAVKGQPWVEYRTDQLFVATKNGTFGGQQSLWKLNTLSTDGSVANTLISASSVPGDLPHSPTVSFDGALLYVASEDTQTLRAFRLDVSDWTETWSGGFGTVETPKGFIWEDWQNFGPLGQRRMYIRTGNGTRDSVRCIQDDGASGSSCWVRQHPSATGIFGSLITSSDGIYVPSNNGKIYKLSYTDGSILSCFAVAGAPVLGDATEDSTVNALFVGSVAGVVYRVNLPIPDVDPVANCNP